MQKNTPPHENQYEELSEDDVEEVYELDDTNEPMDEDDEVLSDKECIDESVVISKHEGSVFCCCFSPCGKFGASGGEDDFAYMWDMAGTILLQCSGHKDSVTCVCFNHDGSYLATGDMAGLIQIWGVEKKERLHQYETDDLNWLLFHPLSSVLFAGTNSGTLWMWRTSDGATKTAALSNKSIECAKLTRDGRRICAAYADGGVKIIKLKDMECENTLRQSGSQVTSIAVHHEEPIVAVGTTEGNAELYNYNKETDALIAQFSCKIMEDPQNCGPSSTSQKAANEDDVVEVVTFCPTNKDFLVTATLFGLISVWNIPTKTLRHHIVQGCGSATINWHPIKPFIITACLDGCIRVYDVRSADRVLKYKGHDKAVLDCDINTEGTTIMSSSDDTTILLTDVSELLNI